MRIMRWSYRDLQELPVFHYEVLVEQLAEEARHAEHQRALAEIRAHMRRKHG